MADISFGHGAHSGFLGRIADRFWAVMEEVAKANSRARQIEFLSGLTDEQLAARGLKREDIARHVFRDVMYL